jgi:cell division septation protein DedD
MPRTDQDPIGEGFKWRLRAELNRVVPRYSSPRYASPTARHLLGAWRIAPVGLSAGVVGILALTAYAATGSPNPVVWTERIVTTVQPNVTTEASPSPAPSPPPSEPAEAPPAAAPPAHDAEPTPEPSERPESSPQPEPSASAASSSRTGDR